MKRQRNEDISKLDRIFAIIASSILFGIISIIASSYIMGYFSLNLGSLFLRSLPGIALGTWLGIRYPKIALFFGSISIG